MQKSKKIGIVIVSMLLLMKALMAPILFLDYQLRKEFIVKNYCINKNRPQLHCDGKCYLAKQLKKAEQRDEKQNTNNSLQNLLAFECISNFDSSFDFPPIAFLKNKLPIFSYKSRATIGYFEKIVKPPQV